MARETPSKIKKQLTLQDSKLSEESLKASKSLYDEKVISKEELRQITSKYLAKELALQEVSTALLNQNAQKVAK